jgi:glycolate oxidase FAD binding subunit
VDSAKRLVDPFEIPDHRPQTPEDVGELVRQFAHENKAIYPYGGRTQIGVGYPASRPGMGIDLRSLTRVIDYPARDMTITVQAGITIRQLKQLLATENQRLPVDIPRADEATLGGSLAVNVSGSRRYGFGTLRDYVIGITVVNDEGQETKAGGRVVKNVAGYDLCKLHIGALGTLGVITQVTLKVRPTPETQALLTLGCCRDLLPLLLDKLHSTRTRPVCIDVLNTSAAKGLARRSATELPDAPWVVIVGFEDSELSVTWQVQRLMSEIPATQVQGLQALAGGACKMLWDALVELPLRPEALLTFKANLLPFSTAEFCQRALEANAPPDLYAHAGSGIVWGHVNGDLTRDQACAMLENLTRAAGDEGNVIVPHCPDDWKRSLPLWGKPRGDAELMRQVIAKLDPRRLFNTGRFLNGT